MEYFFEFLFEPKKPLFVPYSLKNHSFCTKNEKKCRSFVQKEQKKTAFCTQNTVSWIHEAVLLLPPI